MARDVIEAILRSASMYANSRLPNWTPLAKGLSDLGAGIGSGIERTRERSREEQDQELLREVSNDPDFKPTDYFGLNLKSRRYQGEMKTLMGAVQERQRVEEEKRRRGVEEERAERGEERAEKGLDLRARQVSVDEQQALTAEQESIAKGRRQEEKAKQDAQEASEGIDPSANKLLNDIMRDVGQLGKDDPNVDFSGLDQGAWNVIREHMENKSSEKIAGERIRIKEARNKELDALAQDERIDKKDIVAIKHFERMYFEALDADKGMGYTPGADAFSRPTFSGQKFIQDLNAFNPDIHKSYLEAYQRIRVIQSTPVEKEKKETGKEAFDPKKYADELSGVGK